MNAVSEVLGILAVHGPDQYGAEAVSQAEHGLQCALLAEQDGAAPPLVAAALLHDIGHMLSKSRDPDKDDRHEAIGGGWLERHFGAAVAQPVALHVAAKRYLCAVEPSYFATLSPVSVRTLELQGGPMSLGEVAAFEALPYATDAVRLRRWDEQGKLAGMATRALADYESLLRRLAL
jgi:gamma-butyrobetaine dioxygenase